MKWNNKQIMSYDEADALLDRYYNGFTTGEEEKRLRLFLSQPGLPAHYEPEKAIFGYLDTTKAKSLFSIRPYMRWVGGIAAMLVLAVGLQWYMDKKTSDYAFVDGVKITDKQLVIRVAESSMKEMSGGTEGQSVKLDPKELMKQQLGAFSE